MGPWAPLIKGKVNLGSNWKVIPGPNLFYIWRNVIPVQCAPLKGDSCTVCPTKRWFLCSVPYWKVIPVQCAILKGDSWVQLTKLIIKLFMILNPVLSSSLFIFHNTTLFPLVYFYWGVNTHTYINICCVLFILNFYQKKPFNKIYDFSLLKTINQSMLFQYFR